MASFFNQERQAGRLRGYAAALIVVACLLVLAGAAATVLLWSGSWLVLPLALADVMMLAVALWFVRAAALIRRRCAQEIRRLDLDERQITVHYGDGQESIPWSQCLVERGEAEPEGWDFRVRTSQRGIQLLTDSFTDAGQLRTMLAARSSRPKGGGGARESSDAGGDA